MHETSGVEQTPLSDLYADEDAQPAEQLQPKVIEVNKDYLDDLRRLQAEFDNYRKRSVKEQASAAQSGAKRLVEKLLPVLDNFDLALAHGAAGSGVELVHKELMEALRGAGLEEVPAEGHPFDPEMHEAVESLGDGGSGHIVTQVYRRGYRFGDQLIRPAMVVVGDASREDAEA